MKLRITLTRRLIDRSAAVLITGALFLLLALLLRIQVAGGASISAMLSHDPTTSPLPTPLPAPSITAIQPDHGSNRQPVRVTITGANFVDRPTVYIARHALTDVEVVNDTQINATVPPGIAPGKYGVVVCNPDRKCAELPAAYTVLYNPAPILLYIEPEEGQSDAPNDVTLYGRDLRPGIQITIGNVPLQNIHWIRSTVVQAVVPAGLPAGTYAVSARNTEAPETSVLEHAYTVLDRVQDDFFASDDDIWIAPAPVRQGDHVMLGLNVHRQGGNESKSVDVAFYLGDPDHGGTLLGYKLTPPMLSGSDVKSVAIEWDTTGLSSPAHIYVVIDPNNLVTEANKQNNKADRAITILPRPHDEVPPTINRLLINDGARIVTSPQITVMIDATDTGGSGLSVMYMVEWLFNSNVRHWVAAQETGWVPFQSTYPMTLTDRGGMHYIQAWVADGAGNISRGLSFQRVEYIPPSDSIRAKEVRFYQHWFAAGEAVTITLQTLSGDADLYVWSPYVQYTWRSVQDGTTTDQVSFIAPLTGTYAIEVYGYLDSQYRLTIRSDGATHEASLLNTRRAPADKAVLAAPDIAPDSQPLGTIAVPDVPSTHYAYMPMVLSPSAPEVHWAFLPAVIHGQ